MKCQGQGHEIRDKHKNGHDEAFGPSFVDGKYEENEEEDVYYHG